MATQVLSTTVLLGGMVWLDQYQYWVSADTHQYQWVSVSADTSSPVIRLPVSAVNTVAMHAYSLKSIPYFRTYTLHTYITCTYLYPAQNCIFSTKARYRYSCAR